VELFILISEDSLVVFDLQDLGLGDSMTVVWWVIISFRLLMSCRTSLVVTRPLLSSGPANSGFEYATAVASFPLRGLLLFRGTIVSKSSRVKSRAPLWMFVGEGSGPPVGGSAIGPGLVPARHTITFYIAIVSTARKYSTDNRLQSQEVFEKLQSSLYRRARNQFHFLTLFSALKRTK
jgi:hypothetical protein